jgi:hypothetical protein
MPRSHNSFSTSQKLRQKRKYSYTAWLLISTGKLCQDENYALREHFLQCEQIAYLASLWMLFLNHICENRLTIGTVSPGKTLSLLALGQKSLLRSSLKNGHGNVNDFRHSEERFVIFWRLRLPADSVGICLAHQLKSKNGVSMRAQQVKKLICLFSVVVGFSSVPLVSASNQAASSNKEDVEAAPDYDIRARQEEERYLRQLHAAQHQILEHKRHILLYRLTQQEREAREAAEHNSPPSNNDVPLSNRLAQIERVYAQKRAQLEHSLAKEHAQEHAALALEQELSRRPD